MTSAHSVMIMIESIHPIQCHSYDYYYYDYYYS